MKNIQLIIVVESDSKSKTDFIYIKKFLYHFYNIEPYVTLTPIFLKGKSKCLNETIKDKIEEYKVAYSTVNPTGKTEVLMCIDTDDIYSNAEDSNIFKNIISYCEKNNYKLVHFNKNIEEVMLNKKVDSNIKVKTAASFKIPENFDVSKLRSNNHMQNKSSNLLAIFDKILEKKKLIIKNKST